MLNFRVRKSLVFKDQFFSNLDTGDTVGASAQGTWEPSGKHKWRLRGAANFSDGRIAATEGEADLQTLAGKLSEWS